VVHAFFLEAAHESLQVGIEVWRPRRQPHGRDAGILQDAAVGGAELRVAVHEDRAFPVQKAVLGIGQIAGDLFHPGLLGIRRTTREVNAAGGEFHDEEQVDGDQAVLGPDFDRREIDRRQHVPMGLEKGLPGGLPLSIGGRLDAVPLQDVAHGCIREGMPKVGQGALDPVGFARQPSSHPPSVRRGD
jgi:hypothetical protein